MCIAVQPVNFNKLNILPTLKSLNYNEAKGVS